MLVNWITEQEVLKTINQIMAAGIAVTTFSLFLYGLQFNLKDRVARTFLFIMLCVTITYTAESLGSSLTRSWNVDTWLRLEWVGIILLPATYMHFSDSVLALTGKPSRGKRFIAVRIAYIISFLFLITLPSEEFFGSAVLSEDPAPYLKLTIVNLGFIVYYIVLMGMSWYNLLRAYLRTKTTTSRRRMLYLMGSAMAPAIGSFPFMIFGSGFASQHTMIFWIFAIIANLFVIGLIPIMAYSVSFFGVSWPDRVVKSRLSKWILRGPFTAILVLTLVTVFYKASAYYEAIFSPLIPVVMMITYIICQFLITLFGPFFEMRFVFGQERQDIATIRELESRFLTKSDLTQFLELIISAICDRLQVSGGYIIDMNNGSNELFVHIGKISSDQKAIRSELEKIISNGSIPESYQWGNDLIIPLSSYDEISEMKNDLHAVLCITETREKTFDDEQKQALGLMVTRASMAIKDWYTQNQILASFQDIEPEVEFIQRIKAVGRFDDKNLLINELQLPDKDMAQWVKDALNHYWGGPRLTDNPLMNLQIVKDALQENEGSQINALRAVLRTAIERVKPEGERRFTAEWILYNILEMKFVEGRKVRDIALRLAVSEADLYRKQRIAIDTVAKEILEMESKTINQTMEK